MKKNLKLFAILGIAATSMFMSSCSNDEDYFLDVAPQSKSQTIGVKNVTYTVIDFEQAVSELAGSTSYGENLYANYSGTPYTEWNCKANGLNRFYCGINDLNGTKNYYNGGIAISNWNIMSNPSGETGDWWYSYLNQCSVYNTQSTDGTNSGAGHNGSNNFGVMFGYSDSYNSSYMSNPEFHFTPGAEVTVKKLYICNSSYSCGVMVNGNSFGIYGKAVSLEEAKGWFKVLAYGYDAAGNPTNEGNPVEKYICDYRTNANPVVPLKTTWEEWDLSALGAVNKVKFNFEGSDSGTYGLNSPAYLCIDNIHIY